MRIPSAFLHATHRPDVAMTPMIDVVFLLLVFFLWTASFQIVEQRLPSQLSETVGSGDDSPVELEKEDFETIVVRIGDATAPARWIVNEQPVDRFEEVEARLRQVAAIRADLPVLIDPAPSVPLDDVLAVYDSARQAGFSEIQFTTSERL